MSLRSTILGGLAGLLVLAGIAGFAIGLPALVGEDESASPPVAELFPASLLDGALVPLGEASSELAEANRDQEEAIAARQSEVYDADYAVRHYADASFSVVGGVTILDREAGLFQPQGAPAELAEGQSLARATTQVVYGDVICYETWGSVEQIEENQRPEAVQCRRGADGRTFDIYLVGTTADQTASALNEVVAHARSVDQDQ